MACMPAHAFCNPGALYESFLNEATAQSFAGQSFAKSPELGSLPGA